jgi:hypothetical protein
VRLRFSPEPCAIALAAADDMWQLMTDRVLRLQWESDSRFFRCAAPRSDTSQRLRLRCSREMLLLLLLLLLGLSRGNRDLCDSGKK